MSLLTGTYAWAQEISISGSVTDSSTGEPLPGVTVVEKGTSNGTITNPEGSYTLSVAKGVTIQFSYVGYKTVELIAESATLNVKLQEDLAQLDEVVVIGYGQVKKGDATG
ncbi:MAG: carboxypeptidase-like regulatory domain-containing protein, partial [Mangrovibacterium sp.]